MAYEVEFTDEFFAWWNGLDADEQESVAFSVKLLEAKGPALGRPHVDTLYGSAYPNMKELRVQHAVIRTGFCSRSTRAGSRCC